MRSSLTNNCLNFSSENVLVNKNLFFDQELKAYWFLISKCSQKLTKTSKTTVFWSLESIRDVCREIRRKTKAIVFSITCRIRLAKLWLTCMCACMHVRRICMYDLTSAWVKSSYNMLDILWTSVTSVSDFFFTMATILRNLQAKS